MQKRGVSITSITTSITLNALIIRECDRCDRFFAKKFIGGGTALFVQFELQVTEMMEEEDKQCLDNIRYQVRIPEGTRGKVLHDP